MSSLRLLSVRDHFTVVSSVFILESHGIALACAANDFAISRLFRFFLARNGHEGFELAGQVCQLNLHLSCLLDVHSSEKFEYLWLHCQSQSDWIERVPPVLDPHQPKPRDHSQLSDKR